jgi:rubrerythrin
VERRQHPRHRVLSDGVVVGVIRAVHGLAAIRAFERMLGRRLPNARADEILEIPPAPVPRKPIKPSGLLHFLPPGKATCPTCGYADPQRHQTTCCPSCGTSS